MISFKSFAIVSAVITSIVVYQIASVHQQFYPTMVKLFSQKVSRIVLVNDGIVGTILLGKFLVWMFFGSLEAREEEESWDRSCGSIIETCLALTVFREELSTFVFVMFVISLFIKNFHWISQCRVQHMESVHDSTLGDFGRLYFLLFVLLAVDAFFIVRYTLIYMATGTNVNVLFLSEFLVMSVLCLGTIIRLTLHAFSSSTNPDSKHDDHVFYLDIISDLLQSAIYVCFFVVILMKYGIPLHLLRDIYMTIKSAHKRIMDFLNYRRLAAKLEKTYPNATPEELEAAQLSGTTCVFCRQNMESAKKMPCGHLYHGNCIRTWLSEHNECPTCNAPVDVEEYKEYQKNIKKGASSSSSNTSNNNAEDANAENNGGEVSPLIPELAGYDEETLKHLYQMYMQEQQQQPQQNVANHNQQQQQQSNATVLNPMHFSVPNISDFFSQVYAHQQELNANNQADPRVNQVIKQMYIKYLENVQVIVHETLEKLKNLNEEEIVQ